MARAWIAPSSAAYLGACVPLFLFCSASVPERKNFQVAEDGAQATGTRTRDHRMPSSRSYVNDAAPLIPAL